MSHTWDIVVDYHQCPKCGFINESRVAYKHNKKEVICGRCNEKFTLTKEHTTTFGPIFGNGTLDYTWD